MLDTRPLPTLTEREDQLSLLVLGTVLLRRRRWIVGAAIVGGLIGFATGYLSTRQYVSAATFIPEGTEGSRSGLALAASQFGISVPTQQGTWTTEAYVELLRSRALLEPIALGMMTVREEGGRTATVMDLLNIGAKGDTALRRELTVARLRRLVKASDIKTLNGVRLTVTTPWASVSESIARQLLDGVTRFNREIRKSQAGAERAFVDTQAVAAERALRDAEERLLAFEQSNRFTGNPKLTLERSRLQREVSMRLDVYTTMVQNREEARIREVRNTPVISLIEEPRRPASGEPRRSVTKAIIGAFAAAALAVVLALASAALARARARPLPEHEEFFSLMDELKPRMLRRSPQSRP